MMVAGRLLVLKSCICCTRYARCWPARLGIPWRLTPFVPWQLAHAAARLRPRLGSVPCARAGTARTAPEASAATSSGRLIVDSSKDFLLVLRVSFRSALLSRGADGKNKGRQRRPLFGFSENAHASGATSGTFSSTNLSVIFSASISTVTFPPLA